MDSAPVETQINGNFFRIGRLTPRKALHVARRLIPFLGAIVPHIRAILAPQKGAPPTSDEFFDRAADLAPALAEIISGLKDEEVDYILDTCLSVVYLKQERNWAPVMSNGVVMIQSIDLKTQLLLTAEVVKYNLSDFFVSSQPKESEAAIVQ